MTDRRRVVNLFEATSTFIIKSNSSISRMNRAILLGPIQTFQEADKRQIQVYKINKLR